MMTRSLLCLFALLAGCEVVGPAEETADCVDGQAIIEGPGPVTALWQESEGSSKNLGMIWVANGDEVTVTGCTDGWTVVVVR